MPVVLDLATGLRRGELLGLRIRDVDVARNRIQVCQALRKSADGGLEMGRRQT
jgi:integrase